LSYRVGETSSTTPSRVARFPIFTVWTKVVGSVGVEDQTLDHGGYLPGSSRHRLRKRLEHRET